jgi:hypothetical protein
LKGPDPLAGQPEGKALEAQATSSQPGNVALSLQAPYFYAGPNIARVNLAGELPANSLKFEKEKGQFHCNVNVLGIAYLPDGAVAARFSDTVKLDLEKDEMKELTKQPFKYRHAFDVAPGKYKLEIVMSTGGEGIAKYDMPLEIDAYDGKQFGLSSVALSDDVRPVSKAVDLDSALMEGRTPMVTKDVQLIPKATYQFKTTETVGFYFEVYDPKLLDSSPPNVGVIFNIYDRKTQKEVYTSGTAVVNPLAQAGNPIIPIAFRLPVNKLPPGEYRLELHARDENMQRAISRDAAFQVN